MISKLKDINNTPKVEKTIEYLFYLLVILYFVGKVFKPITLIIDVLFIYQLFKNKHLVNEYYQEYKNLIVAFGIFIGYLLFQSLFLELKYYTFKSSFETILYVILVFAALYNFTTKEKIKKLIYASYAILFFLALDSFYQYFTGVDFFGKEMYGNARRLTAWQDTSKVNLMMGQFFGLLIASIFIFEGKEKKLAIFMFMISMTLFIIAGNRSPLLALFTSIFTIGLLSSKRKYILAVFIFIILALSTAVFTNDSLKKDYKVLLNPTSEKANSGRSVLFETGFEIYKDNKYLGIGSHNYKYYHSQYYNKLDKSKYDKGTISMWNKIQPNSVHSVAIDILISYGILGFLILIYVLFNIYRQFIKNNEIGLLASIGFLYCITPFQFGRSFTLGDWQFITYLGLIFLVLLSKYNTLEGAKK